MINAAAQHRILTGECLPRSRLLDKGHCRDRLYVRDVRVADEVCPVPRHQIGQRDGVAAIAQRHLRGGGREDIQQDGKRRQPRRRRGKKAETVGQCGGPRRTTPPTTASGEVQPVSLIPCAKMLEAGGIPEGTQCPAQRKYQPCCSEPNPSQSQMHHQLSDVVQVGLPKGLALRCPPTSRIATSDKIPSIAARVLASFGCRAVATACASSSPSHRLSSTAGKPPDGVC